MELFQNKKNIIIIIESLIIIIFIISCLIYYFYFYENNTCSNEPVMELEVNDFISEATTIKEVEEEIDNEEISLVAVDVKGQVVNSGVYFLEEGKRVNDVISAAGGLTKEADTSTINMSKKISDEMVLIIYSRDEVESYVSPEEIIKIIEQECVCPEINIESCTVTDDEINQEEPTDNNSSLININTASVEELDLLSGVGEAKANDIVEYRVDNPFINIEDIMNVPGIGDTLFANIKESITV